MRKKKERHLLPVNGCHCSLLREVDRNKNSFGKLNVNFLFRKLTPNQAMCKFIYKMSSIYIRGNFFYLKNFIIIK